MKPMTKLECKQVQLIILIREIESSQSVQTIASVDLQISCLLLPSPNGGYEVDFACLTNFSKHTHNGNVSVHYNG